jgi:hypothetical protein
MNRRDFLKAALAFATTVAIPVATVEKVVAQLSDTRIAEGFEPATFQTMVDVLKQYLPDELLREEMLKRDFFLAHIPKDDNWKGAVLAVPFNYEAN